LEDRVITTINPALVPTKAPGTLFEALSGGDSTLNIRWLVALDPVYYETLNRAVSDVALRQLIIAKSVDNLSNRLGSRSVFPFINQPTVTGNTSIVDVPVDLFWDFHVSLPSKWQNVRLAMIKRISGDNEEYTGKLRLLFTANVEDSATETYLFYVDYDIDSPLGYQIAQANYVTSDIQTPAISSGERQTVAGNVILKSLGTERDDVVRFLELLAPPGDTEDSDHDGEYDSPTSYEITDSAAGGTSVTDDISLVSVSHGTGLLTSGAINSIPKLDSDVQSWLETFNYPFDTDANRLSTDSILIPSGLFREFAISAPAGDEPTGDTSGTYYPVWINRIERIGTTLDTLKFYFSTYSIVDEETGDTPSTTAVEFATLELSYSMSPGTIVDIVPANDLFEKSGVALDWQQHFGRGHVVLSEVWSKATSDLEDFYNVFSTIQGSPADTTFSLSSTRLSSFSVQRTPKYIPTIGQSYALRGSSSRRNSPLSPNLDNRYVTELDQGQGDQVDLEAVSGITTHPAISRYGYSGSLCHKIVRLEINGNLIDNDDPNFYANEILPRLTVLFGRAPVFGDEYYNGIRFMKYNGDTWIG